MPPPPAWLSRTRLLLGETALERLAAARVCVIGLGAVGGYVVEGLARSGVGKLRLVDCDAINESNLNRQMLALHSTLGKDKAEVAAARVRDINPQAEVEAVTTFAHDETLPELLQDIDLVVDAVDSLAPKAAVIAAGWERGLPVYSALGAATRVRGEMLEFGALFSAKGCPLGRLVRKRLRKRGISGGDMWCVYSREERNLAALEPPQVDNGGGIGYKRGRERTLLGSMATITGLFGLRLSHEVVLRISQSIDIKRITNTNSGAALT